MCTSQTHAVYCTYTRRKVDSGMRSWAQALPYRLLRGKQCCRLSYHINYGRHTTTFPYSNLGYTRKSLPWLFHRSRVLSDRPLMHERRSTPYSVLRRGVWTGHASSPCQRTCPSCPASRLISYQIHAAFTRRCRTVSSQEHKLHALPCYEYGSTGCPNVRSLNFPAATAGWKSASLLTP